MKLYSGDGRQDAEQNDAAERKHRIGRPERSEHQGRTSNSSSVTTAHRTMAVASSAAIQ
jgi:hypothetical protein